jgi:uncharacterized protein involved in exopolysaccharide biosynthesis
MPREQSYRPGETGAGPASTGLGDVALMLWRERGFMLVVFLISFVLLAGAAMVALQKTYTATASLLVRFDQAYALTPAVGAANPASGLGIEQIVQSEISILSSDVLKESTLDTLGLRAVYPDLANDYVEAPPGEARERVMAKAIRRVAEGLGVGTTPTTANIGVSFEHERADVSARFLNALLDQYRTRRQEVLLASNPENFQDQRDELEARLTGASAALEAFLTESGIGDFDSYRTNLQSRQNEVDQALYAARADAEQARAQLGALRAQISQMPAETEQYVEDSSSAQMVDLMLQKQDLLARYTEDSVPVQEIQARIDQMAAFLTAGGAEGGGTRRVGPNPVRQELQGAEATLAAEAQSLDRRVAELTRQKNELRDEQIRIQRLSPEYDLLARNIASLQSTVNEIAMSQETNRAQRLLASGALDNVSVVQHAAEPSQGSSLKKPAVAGAFVLSGFLSLLAGLARGLLRGGPATTWMERARRERPARPARPPRAARAARPERIDQEPEADPFAPTPRLPVLAVIERRAPAGAYG